MPLPYADITNPQSLNKYSYCYNSPLAFVDPDGHNPLFWALAALGAILAGADTANAPGPHDSIYRSEQGGNVAVTIAANAAFGAALKYASSFLATSASKLFKAATVEKAEAMVLANAERGGQFANQVHGIVGTVLSTSMKK